MKVSDTRLQCGFFDASTCACTRFAASVKIPPPGILIYIGLLRRLCAVRGWENPLLEYSPMDTWRVSNSVSFINRSRKRRKNIEILLANSWNIRVTYSTERWWVVVLHPPSGITCHFNRSRNFVPPSRASRRMGNLPPRFRGRVHALDTLDVGLERVEKMEGGGGVFHRVLSQAKVLALSRHRVLRGDGT